MIKRIGLCYDACARDAADMIYSQNATFAVPGLTGLGFEASCKQFCLTSTMFRWADSVQSSII